MRRPGSSALLLCLPAALGLLTGCSKPTPAVTVQSGNTSVRSAPIQYILDGKTVGSTKGPKVLLVRPGDRVNISVDKKTATAGWVVLLGGQKISPIIGADDHHFGFQAPSFAGATEASLAIYQQPPDGGPAAGAWVFTLREEV